MTKRIVTVLLVLCMIIGLVPALSGCSSLQYDSLPDSYNAETDYPQMFYRSAVGPYVTPSENGYYFIAGSFIYYMDQANLNPVILCGRPECQHELETDPEKVWKCNGYISTVGNNFIQYYEKSLYVIGYDIENTALQKKFFLYRFSPDGKSREVVRQINGEEAVQMSAIHRGYFYQYTRDENSQYHLWRMPLDKDDPADEIYTSPQNTVYSELYFWGNQIYISEWHPDESNVYRGQIEAYNVESNSTEILLTNKINDGHYSISGIDENKIFFQYYQFAEDSNIDPSQVFSYDLKTGEQDFVGSIPVESGTYPTLLRSTQEWIVSQESNTEDYEELSRMLLILDDNFETKRELSLSYLPKRYSIAPGDDKYAFIWYWDATYTYCLDVVDKQDKWTPQNILKKTFDELNPYVVIPR